MHVYLSVTKLTATYNPGLYIENEVPLGFLWHSQGMNCVDFVENTAFSLLDELSVDKRDSDGFISRRLV